MSDHISSKQMLERLRDLSYAAGQQNTRGRQESELLLLKETTEIIETLLRPAPETGPVVRPRSEWHEDTGPVLWWHFPIVEPPYCGTPNDTDWPMDYAAGDDGDPVEVDYCTHWTSIPIPAKPWPGAAQKASGPLVCPKCRIIGGTHTVGCPELNGGV